MQATVLLTVGKTSARMEVLDGATVVESEEWTFPRPIERDDAIEEAMTVFHDAYDYWNWLIHGPCLPE